MNKYVKSVMMFLLAFVLLTVISQVVSAKGTAGEYAGVISENSYRPGKGDVIDQNGTVYNLVGDVYQRMMNRIESINYNSQLTVSSAGAVSFNYEASASSATYGKDRFLNYYGWTIVIPTGTVSEDRIKVKVYNLPTNTQTIYLNYATGTVSGLLSYPSTGTYIADLLPGETYDCEVSSAVHPVIMSSGTFSTEKAQATQCR